MDPKEVSDLDVAFPDNILWQGLLPTWEEVPEEFKEKSPWPAFVSRMFFEGGEWPKVKDGVDGLKAKRHIMVCLRSYQPSHEHKIAGVAWLMSQWFELPDGESVLG